MKYLGIDYGEKRIGLATGDDVLKISTPFKVAGSMEDVLRAIKEEEIDVIVIGMPYTFKNDFNDFGSDKGRMQKDVEKFIELLKQRSEVKVITMDERLSSKAADALLGNKKTKAPRDAVAAMLILQSFFDKL